MLSPSQKAKQILDKLQARKLELCFLNIEDLKLASQNLDVVVKKRIEQALKREQRIRWRTEYLRKNQQPITEIPEPVKIKQKRKKSPQSFPSKLFGLIKSILGSSAPLSSEMEYQYQQLSDQEPKLELQHQQQVKNVGKQTSTPLQRKYE